MEKFRIRYASYEDIPAIQKFIDENWKKGHILARDMELFRWQYTSNKLDYVIGKGDGGEILGILGFISYGDTDGKDIALAMWKAKTGCDFLGIKLLKYIMEHEPYRVIFCPGINLGTTERIYRRMGFSIGKMNQWYRLRKQEGYDIAKIENTLIPAYSSEDRAALIEYHNIDEMTADFDFGLNTVKNGVPHKSLTYVERRYFRHPSYQYRVYGVKSHNNGIRVVIILRVQKWKDSRVIRFIDCIGDLNEIGEITDEIDRILETEKAEYIDLYEAGIPRKILKKAGWLNVDETQNIIPNYFAPYELRNVPVYYCTTDERIVLFRGDGDQDRPN